MVLVFFVKCMGTPHYQIKLTNPWMTGKTSSTPKSEDENHFFFLHFFYINNMEKKIIPLLGYTEPPVLSAAELTGTLHILPPVWTQWHKDLSFWSTDMFIDRYLLLKDELRILSKRLAFAGNPCPNCFEKCSYCFANVEDDSKNVPKWLRKTVIQKLIDIGPCYRLQSSLVVKIKSHRNLFHD